MVWETREVRGEMNHSRFASLCLLQLLLPTKVKNADHERVLQRRQQLATIRDDNDPQQQRTAMTTTHDDNDPQQQRPATTTTRNNNDPQQRPATTTTHDDNDLR